MSFLRWVVALVLGLSLLATPAQAETAGPRPVTETSLRIVAANIRSFPVMSHRAYEHDTARLFALPGRKAILGAEIQPRNGERALFHARARAVGYRTVGSSVEVPQSLHPAIDVRHVRVWRLHDAPPGPASPPRWVVVTRARVTGFRVAFISLHLSNGCAGTGNAIYWWYQSRCDAVHEEVADLRDRVAVLHELGFTVVLGGDTNWGRIIRFGPRQSATYAGLMQVSVVPAADVVAHLGNRRLVPTSQLYTDHPIVSAQLTLTRSPS